MKKIMLCAVVILSCQLVEAQFIKEKAISADIGYGLTIPYTSQTEIAGKGFFAQGQLILKVSNWVQLRPYLGFISTNSDGKDAKGNLTDEKTTATAVLIGGKTRLRAPIPYVAPYFEIGVGASIGKFETLTYYDNISKSGIDFHVPFTFGLELGKNHGVDLGLAYYFQPDVRQVAGAFAIGLTFPLNK